MANELRMAACGIDCSQCDQYKVTVHQDLDAAQPLVGWYRSQGWIAENEGAEAVLHKAPLCNGCWNATNGCFFKCGCGKIDFRVCCNKKKINHCGECKKFPCKHYKAWASWHEGHKKAMERLLSLRGGEHGKI